MTPVCVSGFGNLLSAGGAFARFTHHIDMVAALKSITLLTYPRLTASSGLLPRCFLHLCYDWSLCLAQLTPAYGVTSMCRFIQAATALSIDPTAVARCLCCHCGCSLFYSFGFLYSLLPPSRHYASACPHVNRHHSPALHPVFIQLVHTVCFCGR